MKITLHRAEKGYRGTSWRPVQNPDTSMEKREVIQSVRREVPGDQRDKTIQRITNSRLQSVDLLLAGLKEQYTPTRIENNYRKGTFDEGYYYVHTLAAFVHEAEIERAESMPDRIGPGVIISKAVRIEDSYIGTNTEIEAGALIINSLIGDNSVIRKRAIVKQSNVGGRSYLGQFSSTVLSTVGSLSMEEKGVTVGPNVTTGRQTYLGQRTHINPNAWLDDSVRIGSDGFVGSEVMIGEMFTAGHHLHIGSGAVVGAESEFGSFVRVARDVVLVSPTYAEDGALIMNSNLFAPGRTNK